MVGGQGAEAALVCTEVAAVAAQEVEAEKEKEEVGCGHYGGTGGGSASGRGDAHYDDMAWDDGTSWHDGSGTADGPYGAWDHGAADVLKRYSPPSATEAKPSSTKQFVSVRGGRWRAGVGGCFLLSICKTAAHDGRRQPARHRSPLCCVLSRQAIPERQTQEKSWWCPPPHPPHHHHHHHVTQ